MMTILLYGFLGKKFGRVHRYEVNSPAEAVRALNATIDGFKEAVISGGEYRVLRAGKDTVLEENLHEPQSYKETVRIIPVVAGSKRGGLMGIIIGAVLIAASIWMPGLSAVTANYLMGAGVSMVLGGVAQMLFSPRSTTGTSVEAAENKPSYAFDGAVNTVAQGNPVPVCYGRLLVGSQIISAGLSSEQI